MKDFALGSHDQILFAGLHSASLAAELISLVPLETPRTVLLLNSVDPSAKRAIENNVDLTRAIAAEVSCWEIASCPAASRFGRQSL